jgi:hypothetical protein
MMQSVWLKATLTGLAALAMAGCAATTPPSDTPPMTGEADQCGAQALQDYLGMMAAGPVEARIREVAGTKAVRVLGPNDAATMDYRPDRLNVRTDGDGRIVQIRCG